MGKKFTFSVIFFCDVERVEKLVVVVNSEIDRSGTGLDNRLEIVEHVDVRICGQL